MKEHPLIIIKPHAMHLIDKLISEYDNQGKRVVATLIARLPREKLEQHYLEHKDTSFYIPMIGDMVDKSSCMAIYEGPAGTIEKFRKATGPTNPLEAPLDTIRGKYKDEIGQIIVPFGKGGKIIRSIVHCSESVEASQREIQIWAPYFPEEIIESIRKSANF